MTQKEKQARKAFRAELARTNQSNDEQRRMLQSVRGAINAKKRRIKSLERSASAIEHSLEIGLKYRRALLQKLGLKP